MNEFQKNARKKNTKWKLSSELTENRTNIRRDDGSRHRNINIVQTLPKGMSEPNLSTNSNVIFRYSASAKMKHWTEHSLDRSVYFFYRCVFFSRSVCATLWWQKSKNYSSWSLVLSHPAACTIWKKKRIDKKMATARIKTRTNERSSSYQKHNLRQNSLRIGHTMKNQKGNKNAEHQNGYWTKMRHKNGFVMNEPNRWAEWIFILSHHCKNGRKKEENGRMREMEKKECCLPSDSRHHETFSPLATLSLAPFSVSSARHIAITIVVITYAKKLFKNVVAGFFPSVLTGRAQLGFTNFCLVCQPQKRERSTSKFSSIVSNRCVNSSTCIV